MSFLKLLRYDMRCGLFRKRYLLVPLLALLPCCLYLKIMDSMEARSSWTGCMMYCFMGIEPIEIMDTMEKAQLPVLWLILICGCLYLNLDYMLNDLSRVGQQIIIRSGKRVNWYISKCLWNLCSCTLYFVVVSVTGAFLVYMKEGHLPIDCSISTLSVLYRGEPDAEVFSTCVAFLVSFLLPLMTVSALSILQMTLCMLIKPIFAFLSSLLILLTSIYWNSSLILGNGAMGIRSGLLVSEGISPWAVIIECVVVILLCISFGSGVFKRCNIIGEKE